MSEVRLELIQPSTRDELRSPLPKQGVRPLRLHDARHTYASIALAAGKSVRWVAAQLGHASPELTLRVYARAMREEEADLSFAELPAAPLEVRGSSRPAARDGTPAAPTRWSVRRRKHPRG